MATRHLVGVTFCKLYLQTGRAANTLLRCQHKLWLNGCWVRAVGAGSLVPVRGHISVRLSCSRSLLKFQSQDPAWLANKGLLCVWGQGDQQAGETVKWQAMARRPVTPPSVQTQHYLTVCLGRHADSLQCTQCKGLGVNTLHTHFLFSPSACLGSLVHLDKTHVSLYEYKCKMQITPVISLQPSFMCLSPRPRIRTWLPSPLHLCTS